MPLKELTIEGKRVAQDEIRAACCTATMPDSYGVVAMRQSVTMEQSTNGKAPGNALVLSTVEKRLEGDDPLCFSDLKTRGPRSRHALPRACDTETIHHGQYNSTDSQNNSTDRKCMIKLFFE